MEYCSARERFSLDDTGQFEGYASTFDTVIDAWLPTMFHRGCWEKTLKAAWPPVKVLWSHDERDPIGVPLEMREDVKGLYVKAQLSQTSKIADYRVLMRDSVVEALSVGWDPIRYEMEERANVPGGVLRHIHEAVLFEFSPTCWGADRQAGISNVSSRAPQAHRLYSIVEMEALVAQYSSRRPPVTMATPVRPLFAAQSSFKPETDAQYGERIEKQMAALLQHDETEAYYHRARHQHATARADYIATRRALG